MRKTLKPGNSGGCSSRSWWSLFGYGFDEVLRGLLLGNAGSLCILYENPFFWAPCVFVNSDCQSPKSESLVCGLCKKI